MAAVITVAVALMVATLALGPADDPPPNPIARAAFLLTARKHLDPVHQLASDDVLVAAGQAVCDGLRAGVTLAAATQISMNAGLSPDESGGMVGSAIGALCPEFTPLVPQ